MTLCYHVVVELSNWYFVDLIYKMYFLYYSVLSYILFHK